MPGKRIALRDSSSPRCRMQRVTRTWKIGDPRPCERCRAQHLKCIYPSESAKCQRCERSRRDCVRGPRKIELRRVAVSKRSPRTSKRADTAVQTAKSLRVTNFELINETLDSLDCQAVVDGELENPSPRAPGSNQSRPNCPTTVDEPCVDSLQNNVTHSLLDPSLLNGHKAFCGNYVDGLSTSIVECEQLPIERVRPLAKVSSGNHVTTGHEHNEQYADVISAPYPFYGTPSRKSPHKPTSEPPPNIISEDANGPLFTSAADSSRAYLETILLRYFRDELAPSFDLYEPIRCFAKFLQPEAQTPGPLRNALLTVSARSLFCNRNFRSESGIVQWRGRMLPELTEGFATPYYNDCIRDLLRSSRNLTDLHDKTLLAAVLVLRNDQQLRYWMQDDGRDWQLFQKIANLYIDVQFQPYLGMQYDSPQTSLASFAQESTPYSNSSISPPTSIPSTDRPDSGPGTVDFSDACAWTTLRQALHIAFLEQQPVAFPLSRYHAFRQLKPAADYVWARRVIILCADTLELAYGSQSIDGKVAPAYTSKSRWQELRSREQDLCRALPTTFRPTYYRESDMTQGNVFPTILYSEAYHVGCATYIELARLLLLVYNPARPRFGLRFMPATGTLVSSMKEVLSRLCGMASNDHDCLQGLVNACLGISMFGEIYDDLVEQDALLGVLSLMSIRYAYTTGQITNALVLAWYESEEE